jgi:hypothetical protein
MSRIKWLLYFQIMAGAIGSNGNGMTGQEYLLTFLDHD